MFEVLDKKGWKRKGILTTRRGELSTPFFMPIATKGSVRALPLAMLDEYVNPQILLLNTYHHFLRPGNELMEEYKGLHNFVGWDKPILTDSGGYQVFSLSKMRKITEEGVTFRSHLDGNKYLLTPEKSIETQVILDSDIVMVLDECPSGQAPKTYVDKSLEMTTRWAQRSTQELQKQAELREISKKPLLFGIVQGGIFEDLRQKSLSQLQEIDFDGFAIGGVSVGESRSEVMKVIHKIAPMLPEDKPHYLMGLGNPEEIVFSVLHGVDMFDCVIPTREARHGSVFVWKSQDHVAGIQEFIERVYLRDLESIPEDLFYEKINLNRAQYIHDLDKIDSSCDCIACQHYSKAYLRHLLNVKEISSYTLLSIHNLYFYKELMSILRKI
jgi:queuine tRNA-ribosyltransferase